MRKSNESSPARKDRRSHRKGASAVIASGNGKLNTTPPQQSRQGQRDASLSVSLSTASCPQGTAAYILGMTLALRNIANDSGMNFLAYLLDMAAEEADGLDQREKQAAAERPRQKTA